MNTQEIQELDESFDKEFGCPTGMGEFIKPPIGSDIIPISRFKIKSFISQKLKEQEERHEKEIEDMYNFIFDRKHHGFVKMKYVKEALNILSKYE